MVFYTTAACWIVPFLRLINRQNFYEKRFVSFDIFTVNDVWKFNSQEGQIPPVMLGDPKDIQQKESLNCPKHYLAAELFSP